MNIPVLSFFNKTHLLEIVDAVTNDVTVGLVHHRKHNIENTIMVSMTDTIAVLGTEGISERVDTNARSHEEVTSDGSYP